MLQRVLVLGLVGKIKADVESLEPSYPFPTKEDAELLRIWIQEVSRVLSDDDLSPRVREAITALDEKVRKSVWIARLETLQRVLEARLAVLGGPSVVKPSRPESEPASPFEGSPAASTQAAATSTRDEDALVARATESLSGSRAFMVMGAFLVAAGLCVSMIVGGGLIWVGLHYGFEFQERLLAHNPVSQPVQDKLSVASQSVPEQSLACNTVDARYGLIIDAGSSGSRIYIYCWKPTGARKREPRLGAGVARLVSGMAGERLRAVMARG